MGDSKRPTPPEPLAGTPGFGAPASSEAKSSTGPVIGTSSVNDWDTAPLGMSLTSASGLAPGRTCPPCASPVANAVT